MPGVRGATHTTLKCEQQLSTTNIIFNHEHSYLTTATATDTQDSTEHRHRTRATEHRHRRQQAHLRVGQQEDNGFVLDACDVVDGLEVVVEGGDVVAPLQSDLEALAHVYVGRQSGGWCSGVQ